MMKIISGFWHWWAMTAGWTLSGTIAQTLIDIEEHDARFLTLLGKPKGE